MKLQLKQLRMDGGTQPREKIDDCVVADYMERLREGVEFPPVVVFFDGSAYWLADGFHRYYANRRLARTHIEAEVHEGTQRDAILYSVGANCEHGLRRSNADKRRAVETMLTNNLVSMDDKGNPWSDREIARRCHVSPHTVARYREESSHTMQMHSMKRADLPAERTFVHPKTGKPSVMNTKNIGNRRNQKPLTGGIAKDAFKPRALHGENGPVPMRAISLPLNNPQQAARSMFSVYGEDYVRQLFEELQLILKGE